MPFVIKQYKKNKQSGQEVRYGDTGFCPFSDNPAAAVLSDFLLDFRLFLVKWRITSYNKKDHAI